MKDVEPFDPRDVARFSPEEVVRLTGPRLTVDTAWRSNYGEEIPDRLRIIPELVVYLIAKYEVLPPQWLLASTVAQSCSPKGEDDPLALGTALKLIEEAIAFGLISDMRPGDDPRQRLYYLNHEQKLQRMSVLAVQQRAHALAKVQSRQPTNPEAGLSPRNKAWYKNPLEMIMRHDDVYHANVSKLTRVIAIMKATFGKFVAITMLTGMTFIATYGEVLAGISTVKN